MSNQISLYRIKTAHGIEYSEEPLKTINYKTQTKDGKRKIIAFIRSHYSGVCLRSIVCGDYKAIFDNRFLKGVQFDMSKLKRAKNN